MGVAKIKIIKKLADTFGVLGYLSAALVWLWAVVLVLPWLMSLQNVKDFVSPSHEPHIQPLAITYQTPPQWAIYLIVAVAFIIVILGFVAAFRMPKQFVSSTSRGTHRVADKLALEITHHQHMPKRKIHEITETIVWLLKICLVFVPFIMISVVVILVPTELDKGLAFGIGAYLTAWPILWFGLQYMTTLFDRTEEKSF